jgi:uncharacterized protein YigA (DUF484 family)
VNKITNVERVEAIEPDETSIIDYLKKHPDLFERHPEVLKQLTFTHDSGAAVSLVERQLKLIRDENQGMKNKLSSLVHIARENEELGQRFHRLTLELMAGDDLNDIIAMTRDQVQTFFYTDHVGFRFHDSLRDRLKGLETSIIDSDNKHSARLRDWMGKRKPVFGPFDPGMHKQLFGEQGQIQSAVLIPLHHTRDFGLLVLGSRSRDRFADNMGTVFLTQLGELISAKICNFLS